MFPISPIFADYLRRPDRELIIKATIAGKEYDDTKIVDFSIENSLSLTDGFQIGTAIPSKLTIKLRTNEEIPANARIVPYLSLSMSSLTWDQAVYPWQDMHVAWDGGMSDWLPLGEFFVDSREKIKDVWTYVCYDKLVFADVAYISSLSYPTTQKAVWDEICGRLGWTYDSSVVIDSAYQIQAGPAGYSMRQVLSYIASANSSSIYIDKAGTLKFKRFTASETPVFDMKAPDYIRVKQTNPMKTYTRVVVTYNTEDELTYEAGTGDENHTLNVENPFATQAITNALLTSLNGFTYLPIQMDARGFPQLSQGDVIGFEQQEGSTWLETVTAWQDTHIPWDGIVRYKTVILHQVFDFKGGLKMSLEAPSISEQQSEFQVDGTLTTAVNNLNKDAVKFGKPYYGVSHSRTEGIVVEREDHASKAVFNSDELSFYADGDKALWFDLPNRRFKFTGTLEGVDGEFSGRITASEFIGGMIQIGSDFSVDNSGHMKAVDGEFSGEITASVITGGQINGGTITGAMIQTDVAGSYPRAEMSSTDNLFGAYKSSSEYIKIQALSVANASPQIELVSGANGLYLNQFGGVSRLYNTGSRLDVTVRGDLNFTLFNPYDSIIMDFGQLLDFSKGTTLYQQLLGKADKGSSTGLSGSANGGIPIGTVLRTADGGTVTWNGIQSHSHPQN